jgi:hypothetical protein
MFPERLSHSMCQAPRGGDHENGRYPLGLALDGLDLRGEFLLQTQVIRMQKNFEGGLIHDPILARDLHRIV